MFNEDEVPLELIKPVSIGKGEGAVQYTEITLREPNAGELEKAARADTNVGSLITMISLVAKIPRSAVEKFSRADLQAAEAVLGSFTGGGQATPTAGDD
jgi:hypothetical protein